MTFSEAYRTLEEYFARQWQFLAFSTDFFYNSKIFWYSLSGLRLSFLVFNVYQLSVTLSKDWDVRIKIIVQILNNRFKLPDQLDIKKWSHKLQLIIIILNQRGESHFRHDLYIVIYMLMAKLYLESNYYYIESNFIVSKFDRCDILQEKKTVFVC